MADEPDRWWVIWSFEHQAWWRPDWRGYTDQLSDAGRYSTIEAGLIVVNANVVAEEERALPLDIAERQGPPRR